MRDRNAPRNKSCQTGRINHQIVLRFCQEIETTCSSIYSYFAEIFVEDPALQKLWSKIADEELNHAQIVSMAMRCKGLILKEKQYDMAKFRNSAKTLREVLDNLQNMTPSAEEALRAAINLEKRLAEFHLDHVLKFTSLAEENFFNQLMEGDRQHIRQFEQACQLIRSDKI